MRVLVISSIDSDAIAKMSSEHDVKCHVNPDEATLSQLIQDREVLILRSGVFVNAGVMDSAPELKLIIRAGCGLDNIDVEHARRRCIKLHTIPQPAAFAVSEMTFALMLALARRVLEAHAAWSRGKWLKTQLKGRLLYGKTLGIIGAGNIGSRVGQLGNALGMRVLGCVEYPTPERAQEYLKKNIELTDLDKVVAEADFLTIHVPKKESTKYLVNADVLANMKKDSFLVNIARGGVVDEKALYHELTEGSRLLGAALDVHEQEGDGKISPFADMHNVILTPHIGSMTVDTYKDMGIRILRILNSFVAKQGESQVAQEALA
ncbi:MAG: NAD(P)-dependent oxidoreductase [Calditrichaeota bacterium]|nr:NAD(P)-dependent oxidoreductase [Calditrichota bacterium]